MDSYDKKILTFLALSLVCLFISVLALCNEIEKSGIKVLIIEAGIEIKDIKKQIESNCNEEANKCQK